MRLVRCTKGAVSFAEVPASSLLGRVRRVKVRPGEGVIALPYENLLEDPRPWHLRAPKHPVESTCPLQLGMYIYTKLEAKLQFFRISSFIGLEF